MLWFDQFSFMVLDKFYLEISCCFCFFFSPKFLMLAKVMVLIKVKLRLATVILVIAIGHLPILARKRISGWEQWFRSQVKFPFDISIFRLIIDTKSFSNEELRKIENFFISVKIEMITQMKIFQFLVFIFLTSLFRYTTAIGMSAFALVSMYDKTW